MSHDTEAQVATQKIAKNFMDNNKLCFSDSTVVEQTYTSLPDRRIWPVPDGIIKIKTSSNEYNVALEYKRPEEQKHGILTALGQSISYIEQGYEASLIVVPKSYSTKDPRPPEEFIPSVLNHSASGKPIGVWVYDHTVGTMECIVPLKLDSVTISPAGSLEANLSTKQWMFVREGEFNPGIIFKYLQTAKRNHDDIQLPPLHPELEKACRRLYSTVDPVILFSGSPNNNPNDKIWKSFWYNCWFTKDVQTIWKKDQGRYIVNKAQSDFVHWDGQKMLRFCGQGGGGGTKGKIVEKLNNNTITEDQAWEEFVENLVSGSDTPAKSAKKTVEAAVTALGFVNEFGKLTSLGYRFVDESELNDDDPYVGSALKILRYTMLNTGGYFNFLKNIFELSEKKLKNNASEFLGTLGVFDKEQYLQWIEKIFTNELHIMTKVSSRGGVSRKPFTADVTILKQFGFITGKFRQGVGMEINWPFIQESMNIDNIQ